MNTTEYKKLRIVILSQLKGLALSDPAFFDVIRAISYAEKIHVNHRKDGNPEFSHQLNILGFALNMHLMLKNPVAVYVAIVLHDLVEDYPKLLEQTRDLFPKYFDYCFGLSKIRFGEKLSNEKYFGEIANCYIMSTVKGLDRMHNQSSMIGPFTIEKQHEYIDETNTYFFPMLKSAKKKFPEMGSVFELIKSVLNIQCMSIKACYSKAA